jgi:RimJ/RimL family protein N-acetyltransferase
MSEVTDNLPRPFETLPPETWEIPETGLHAHILNAGDADKLVELAQDPAAQKFIPWIKAAMTEETAQSFLERYSKEWQAGRRARYILEDDYGFVGYVGIWPDRIANGYYEFGFGVLPKYKGQGIGPTAVKHLITIAKDQLHAEGMVAHVRDENEASKAAVTKLGFTPTDEIDDGDRRYVLAL